MKLEIITKVPKCKTNKPPLLFVHGAFHGAWCWSEYFLPYFAGKGYHAIALSLRGHGLSEGHEHLHKHSLLDYVDDVTQVVNQLDQLPVLIGHSMGGAIVQKYLELSGCRGKAAVLMASPPPERVFISSLVNACIRPLVYWKFMKYYRFGILPAPIELFLSKETLKLKGKEYVHQLQPESRRIMQDFINFSIDNQKIINIPLLVLGAENDKLSRSKTNYEISKFYGAEVEIIPNIAHDMMIDKNWCSVADNILKWLINM